MYVNFAKFKETLGILPYILLFSFVTSTLEPRRKVLSVVLSSPGHTGVTPFINQPFDIIQKFFDRKRSDPENPGKIRLSNSNYFGSDFKNGHYKL